MIKPQNFMFFTIYILIKIVYKVEPFYNLSNYIGNIIMKFSSQDEMHYIIQNMNKYIEIKVE